MGLAATINPSPTGGHAARVLEASISANNRCVAMAAALVLGSVALLMGLPALLAACADGARALGRLAVAVYSIGILGSIGYASLLLFLSARMGPGSAGSAMPPRLVGDTRLDVALVVWVAAFYVGLLLVAIALFRGRRIAVWVPVLLVVVVLSLPFVSMAGHVGQVLQVLLFTIAMTRIAIETVHEAASGTPPDRAA